MTRPPAGYRSEFPIFERCTYLNSCSLGALSRRSRRRVDACLDLWNARGASAWYDTWWAALEELRTRYARLLGAPAGTVALHPSVSSALGVVGSALDYRARPRVVVTSLDFPTIGYQWMARAGQGVEVVVLESPDGIAVPPEAFERAVNERTVLVATSHVCFTSGAIQPVEAIAGIAHRAGALLLVDGYQAAGQLPVDVRALDVDFYVGGGLKWLLGGSGVAFLHARRELLPSLEPATTGWFAHREQFRFDSRALERHDDARRLETGTPPMMPVYAQLGGLDVLEEVGIPAIRAATATLTEDLISVARERGLAPKVAEHPDARSGIVMLPSPDPHADVRRLAEAGFIVDARPGHVRVSPYFYNLPDDHRALLECLTDGR